MKQALGVVGFLVLLYVVLFGRQTLTAILTPAPTPAPTTRGVVWPTNQPVASTQRAIGVKMPAKAVGIKIAPGSTASPSTSVLDSLLIEPEQAAPVDTDLFESLKLARPSTLDVPDYHPQRELDVPASLKLVRAQPCVYKILQYGDLELRIPDEVEIDEDALMRAYAADGGVPRGDDRTQDPALTQFLWARLSEAPDQYLSFGSEQSVRRFENQLMASGTGFLVSRDGIVLTNAHVIADMDDQPLTSDPVILANLIGTSCDGFMAQTIEHFGGAPSPEQVPQVATSLLRWFAAHGRITGTFRRAELVLQYKKKSRAKTVLMDPETLFNGKPEPIVAPLEVLFKGEPLPGKDVAVLRVGEGDFDPIDRAICLPLGDSDEVLAGARVQALGFPGIAFNEHIMDAGAAYRVSAQDGQVANTKRMTGGYDALEMTADINHGDSGGPVVHTLDGLVIGLNVGAAQANATGHTLAIPVNVAKEMIRELGLTLDPGPATALWIDALAAWDAKDYAAAVDHLSRLVRLQAKWTRLDGTPLKDLPADWVPEWDSGANPYVVDLLRRAKSKLKAE